MKLNILCNMKLDEVDRQENEIIYMNMKLNSLKINYTNAVRNDI